ncbi:hypothetical protein [Clostridium cylindrosporum]|uniref:Uncharacterized protein n=1 Tax=Clostridium cylindrosporum DSM 605 TaxID=1121307 RepID=A0A0J8D4Z2_CLOCY|nr:hypothetical protein [Clostridium cylindrosporum]KMT20887.1 hypothetical protein CLCY_1c01210 [Clostridium cylindrosporum DSM 605]
MGIFSLLFRKNDSLTQDENLKIETVETVSSKIEVVYPSGMLYKSIDSYIPNVDIMEVAVPLAMDIFKEEYTVYSTEKLLSSMFYNLELNLSLRKEIYLLSTGNTINLENFRSIASTELSLVDNSFINRIINNEITSYTYAKLRQVISGTFKTAGKTDPYFSIMNDVFIEYIEEHKDIDNLVTKLSTEKSLNVEDLEFPSKVLFISEPNSTVPSLDIMYISQLKLKNLLAKIYNFNSVSSILSKIIYTLHTNIQNRLNSYEDNISYIDYLDEIKKSIEELDLKLIEMIKLGKIDETTYLTLQNVLVDTFLDAKTYDLYMEAISTMINLHVEKNSFFKEYIRSKVCDFFSDI